ncbi:GGDEF domain-containing protein [Ferrimonas marina]|uniref:diguanylate cyclase n=1 Tax=Ferrimonas marina TaxID=299255 RepID=A0A1M5NBA9_9GAMM|nr:GGDEF domain-containing protein [Ferrimonas marina]SHG86765.1 diguanylate cyclase (GGDEF) domain-containing protein [Ferrimonas marina]
MFRELSPVAWGCVVVVCVVVGLPWWQQQLTPHTVAVDLIPITVLLLSTLTALRFRQPIYSYLGVLLLVLFPFHVESLGIEHHLSLRPQDLYLLIAFNLLWLPSSAATFSYLLIWFGFLLGQCLMLQNLANSWLDLATKLPSEFLLMLPAGRFVFGLFNGERSYLIPLILGSMAWLVVAWPMPWPGPVLLFIGMSLILMLAVFDGAYRLAFRDGLTGLPARRTLDGDMAYSGGRIHVVMIDVDHFKEFNDRFGHNTGDDVLCVVADTLRKVKGAKAYRYGGEEFTLVFKNLPRDEVLLTLDKLRKSIEQMPLLVANGRLLERRQLLLMRNKDKESVERAQITVSLGVAQRHGQHESVKSVIKRADKALYRAKQDGRNQWVLG